MKKLMKIRFSIFGGSFSRRKLFNLLSNSKAKICNKEINTNFNNKYIYITTTQIHNKYHNFSQQKSTTNITIPHKSITSHYKIITIHHKFITIHHSTSEIHHKYITSTKFTTKVISTYIHVSSLPNILHHICGHYI